MSSNNAGVTCHFRLRLRTVDGEAVWSNKHSTKQRKRASSLFLLLHNCCRCCCCLLPGLIPTHRRVIITSSPVRSTGCFHFFFGSTRYTSLAACKMFRLSTVLPKQGKGSCAQMKVYIKNGNDRRSTDDDGVKHCWALPKITTKRVPEGICESIGTSG